MTDAQDKRALREHYRVVRDAIPEDERRKRSDVIARLLLSIEPIERAGSVFLYVSAGSEVGTRGLIGELLHRGLVVAVPRITGDAGVMRPSIIRSLDDLSPGRFGIPEPVTNTWLDTTPEVVVVPGLAFTRTGVRLGQGGGYYDRYLAQHTAAHKVGLCFNEQLAGVLPRVAHDVVMDEVIVG